jgi:hypothetical protein
MKSGLDRVLRVRALLENLSRLELERKIGETGHLRTAAEQQQWLAQLTREDALQILTGTFSDGKEKGSVLWLRKLRELSDRHARKCWLAVLSDDRWKPCFPSQHARRRRYGPVGNRISPMTGSAVATLGRIETKTERPLMFVVFDRHAHCNSSRQRKHLESRSHRDAGLTIHESSRADYRTARPPPVRRGGLWRADARASCTGRRSSAAITRRSSGDKRHHFQPIRIYR